MRIGGIGLHSIALSSTPTIPRYGPVVAGWQPAVKRRKVPGIMFDDGGENRGGFIHPPASVELDTALEYGFPWVFIDGTLNGVHWRAVTHRDYRRPSAFPAIIGLGPSYRKPLGKPRLKHRHMGATRFKPRHQGAVLDHRRRK